MTTRAPKIPPEARKVTVETRRGMFGRDEGIEIHAVAFDRRDPYFSPVKVKSKAAATNLLKRLGFVKVGRPSPYSGAQEWQRLTPDEVAALPRPETSRELIKRWSGNPLERVWFIVGKYRDRDFEIIDEAETAADAARKVAEYRSSFGHGWEFRVEETDAVSINPRAFGGGHKTRPPREPLPEYSKLSLFTDLDGTLRGMARWVEATIPERHRDREVAAMLAHISQHPEDVERGWPHVWKHAREAIDRGEFELNPSGFWIGSLALDVGRRAGAEAKRRARKRRAKSNPEIEPDAPELSEHNTFALLGELIEIEIEGTRGGRRTIRPRANSAALLSSSHATTLWIVWPASTRRTRKPKDAEARAAGKLYRKWSKFSPRVAIKMEASDTGPRTLIGYARVIRYRSDKWTGKPTLYEHTFKGKDIGVWADNSRAPRMIAIMGPHGYGMAGAVLVTERGIIG